MEIFLPPTSQEDERSDARFPRITQQLLPKPRHSEATLFLERRGAMVFFIDKGSNSNEGVTGAGNFPIQYLPNTPTMVPPNPHFTVQKTKPQRGRVTECREVKMGTQVMLTFVYTGWLREGFDESH